MNTLFAIKDKPAPTPAADALAAHDAARAALQTEREAVSKTDAEKLSAVTMLRGIRDGLAGARERRLDLLAEQGLGVDVAASLAKVEADIRTAEREESDFNERAAIATRQRALLAPKLKALGEKIRALDATRPDLERAAEREALVAGLAEYRKRQAAFVEAWLAMHARSLRMDRAKIVRAPLGSQSAVADLVIPLPNLDELKVAELDRRELFARLKELAG